jgi:hypothetical protein
MFTVAVCPVVRGMFVVAGCHATLTASSMLIAASEGTEKEKLRRHRTPERKAANNGS